jgi:hypothetical protein
MKTAGKKNQKRWLNKAASRDRGTEGYNNPAQWGGLEANKTSGRRRGVFSLTPFIELIRTLTEKSRGHEPIGFNRGATNGEIPKETDNKNDGPRGTKCRNGDVARNDGQNVRSRQ